MELTWDRVRRMTLLLGGFSVSTGEIVSYVVTYRIRL